MIYFFSILLALCALAVYSLIVMSLPMLDEQLRSSTALLDAYTIFHKQNEAFYAPDQPNDRLNKISMYIGAGCAELAQGNRDSAYAIFEAVSVPLQVEATNSTDRRVRRRTTARLLVHTLNMLTLDDRPEALQAERHAMHATVASELDDCLQAARDFYTLDHPTSEEAKVQTDRRGRISELTVLGLNTREPSDKVLAMTALANHDWSADSARSHDNLLLTLDDNGLANFYPTQVKAGCFNACREIKGGRWFKVMERYDPSVVVVSGHCDLGFAQESRLSPEEDHFPLANLLVKEAFGNPTAAETDHLSMVSKQLLDTITSGERNGLAGVDRVSQLQ
jgi:hypothetical protein